MKKLFLFLIISVFAVSYLFSQTPKSTKNTLYESWESDDEYQLPFIGNDWYYDEYLNEIIIGEGSYIYVLDEELDVVANYDLSPFGIDDIYYVVPSELGGYYVCAGNDGLFEYDPYTETLYTVLDPSYGEIYHMVYDDENGRFYVSAEDEGDYYLYIIEDDNILTVDITESYGEQVIGDFLFIQDIDALEIYNIANISNPAFVASVDYSGELYDVSIIPVENNLAHIFMAGDNGLGYAIFNANNNQVLSFVEDSESDAIYEIDFELSDNAIFGIITDESYKYVLYFELDEIGLINDWDIIAILQNDYYEVSDDDNYIEGVATEIDINEDEEKNQGYNLKITTLSGNKIRRYTEQYNPTNIKENKINNEYIEIVNNQARIKTDGLFKLVSLNGTTVLTNNVNKGDVINLNGFKGLYIATLSKGTDICSKKVFLK